MLQAHYSPLTLRVCRLCVWQDKEKEVSVLCKLLGARQVTPLGLLLPGFENLGALLEELSVCMSLGRNY